MKLNQQVNINFPRKIKLSIKREDLLHPYISGNKFRKLKYNIIEAKLQGASQLLTFGGAFSNHIAATAAAGKEYNINTIGIIRGEELKDKIYENETLKFARDCGMQFKFITRNAYREKESNTCIKVLKQEFGDFYLVPEGGTNNLAVKGCEEILTKKDEHYTHIACSVGTGGTIAGIINTALPHQKVLGFPALKNAELSSDIVKFAVNDNWQLIEDYHFGGYAKINAGLITFINTFYNDTGIPLDPVYTGKTAYGIINMIHKGYFTDNANILMIHTGGLQGIAGMNNVLAKKKLPLIKAHT